MHPCKQTHILLLRLISKPDVFCIPGSIYIDRKASMVKRSIFVIKKIASQYLFTLYAQQTTTPSAGVMSEMTTVIVNNIM